MTIVVSQARVASLIELNRLEEELRDKPADLEMAAEDVEIFIEVLWEESTKAGHAAYLKLMEGLPEEDYPWSAVRAMNWEEEKDPTWGDLLSMFVYSPPAMALAINRRPELEPEQPGDELPDPKEESGYTKLYNSWFTWDANMALRHMGPVGWVFVDDWDEVGEGASAAVDEAREDVEEVIEDVQETAAEVAEDVSEAAGEAWEGAKETAGEALEKAKEVQQDFVERSAGLMWTLVRPIAIGAGALAGLGVVGLITYGLVMRPKVVLEQQQQQQPGVS